MFPSNEQLREVMVEGWDTDFLMTLCFIREIGFDFDDNDQRIPRQVEQMAKDGNPRAQCALAKLVRTGFFFSMNKESALMWCLRASEQRYVPAQLMAWNLYSDFLGSIENAESLGNHFLLAAVARGYPPALTAAGVAHLHDQADGERVGYAYLENAAEKGEAMAQFLVGAKLIATNDEVSISRGTGFIVKSASAGYRDAIQVLSGFYQRGTHGFEKNVELSSRLFAECEIAMPSDAYFKRLDEWSAM